MSKQSVDLEKIEYGIYKVKQFYADLNHHKHLFDEEGFDTDNLRRGLNCISDFIESALRELRQAEINSKENK